MISEGWIKRPTGKKEDVHIRRRLFFFSHSLILISTIFRAGSDGHKKALRIGRKLSSGATCSVSGIPHTLFPFHLQGNLETLLLLFDAKAGKRSRRAKLNVETRVTNRFFDGTIVIPIIHRFIQTSTSKFRRTRNTWAVKIFLLFH